MTESHDDRTPVEHDPTGMRALLAGLPEPGPMPDDLVSRITAALAAEADAGAAASADGSAAASSAGPTAPASSSSGATVVPLPRRRLQLKHLGVAAAVVGALGLGGVVLATAPNGLTTSMGADESAQDAGSAAGASTQRGAESAPQAPGAGFVPPAGSGEVVVVMSGRAYDASTLAEGARQLVGRQDQQLRSLAAESPGIGPIGTPVGARTCADALGVPASAGMLVDVAEVDGRPAAVLVVDAGAGHTAYAVERSCTTGTTGLIAGPVAVP